MTAPMRTVRGMQMATQSTGMLMEPARPLMGLVLRGEMSSMVSTMVAMVLMRRQGRPHAWLCH